MIAQELVKEGVAFIGNDGKVRQVIMVHKPGNGYSVTWDTVPRSHPEYYDSAARLARPNGYMTMRQFQKWAVAVAVTN